MIISFVLLLAVLVQFGCAAGIASGLVAFLYAVFFFSENHSWVMFEAVNRNKLIVVTFGIIANIIIIARLQKKLIKANTEKTSLEKILLEEIAYTDSMTKLGNRYAYEIEKKRLEGLKDERITIMVCDMNGLKQINDNLGHQYGDKEICRIGELLFKSFSPIAKCYRIGGDEFCVLAQIDDEVDFENRRDEFVRSVYSMVNSEYEVSIATGVATGTTADIDKVFHEADGLMYTCKKEIKKFA